MNSKLVFSDLNKPFGYVNAFIVGPIMAVLMATLFTGMVPLVLEMVFCFAAYAFVATLVYLLCYVEYSTME